MAGAIPAVPLPSADTEAPRVPYDQRRISPDEFGAGVGEGLQRLGQGLEHDQAESDVQAAQEAETAYAQEILAKLHGSQDPQSGEFRPGFVDKKGHDALSGSAPLSKDLEDRRNQIAAQLVSDRQRRIFLGRTQNDLLGAQRTIQTHVDEQWNYLQREALKTRLQTAAMNAAGGVVTGDGAVDLLTPHMQIHAMRPWLEVAAEQQGLKGEDAARFVRQGQGGVAAAVLERLLEDPRKSGKGHAAEAAMFLEDVRPLLDEKEIRQFKSRIEPAELRDKAIAETDRIWKEANGDPNAAIAGSRAVKDGALRDEVERRLGERLREDHAVRVAADSPREARLEIGIYQGRGLHRMSDDYQALSDEGKARIEAKARAASRSDSSEQRAADQELYWTFKGLPLTGAPGADRTSVDVDHSPTFAYASPPMRARIKYEQRQSQGELSKDEGLGRSVFLDKARAIADDLHFLGSEGAGAATKRAKFMRQMETAYDGWIQANPTAKAIPPDEARKMFAKALAYGDLGTGWGLSPNRYAWEVQTPEERAKFTTQGFAQPGAAAIEHVFGPVKKATGPVRLVGPGGKTGTAQAGPELDAWLKAHPDWRAE